MNVVVIGGADIKSLCGTVCDYVNTCAELGRSESYPNEVAFYQKQDSEYVFCNPQFLQHMVDNYDLTDKILITHNTDASLISYKDSIATFRYLSGQEWSVAGLNPRDWYAQNSLAVNVKPLPLGPGEEPFDVPVPLNPTLPNKSIVIYKNFKIDSNPFERSKCDQYVPAENYYYQKLQRQEYYDTLAKSYYAVSPDGFGVDCHRHWEALYYSCIPIVTRNVLTERYSKIYPMCLIDDWSQFNIKEYTQERHANMMKSFDRRYLELRYYINKTQN